MDIQNRVSFKDVAWHIAKKRGCTVEDAESFIRDFESTIDYFCGQKDAQVRLNTGTYTKVKRYNSTVEQITFRQNMGAARRVITPSV